MSTIDAFSKTDIRPPGPSPARGYTIAGENAGDDSAHYLLRPDVDFYRPWIASPGVGATGIAFVWPLGVEGFTLSSTPELGIHKYIGDNNIDVEVIYPDEFHVVLTGEFPGKTSAENFRALRKVILHKSNTGSKILAVPLVAENLLNVAVSDYSFTRDETDSTQTIQYSIEFVYQSVGSLLKLPQLVAPKPNPSFTTAPRGKSTKQTLVPHSPTVRGVARQIYNDPEQQSLVLAKNLNDLHRKYGIPAHQLAYRRLPAGSVLNH